MIKKQILVLGIAAIILLSLGGVAAAVMTPTRDMPAQVVAGQDFDVYVNFMADEDLTNSIGLADNANNTAGMTATVDKTWCTPNADFAYNEVYRANYLWYGYPTKYSSGQSFVAKYSVHVPDGTALGTYTFDGTLEYYADTTHHLVDVSGDTEIEVVGGAPAEVVINEFSSYNSTGDWLELYNKGTSQVLLDGWSLNDSASEIHAFGAGDNISAGGYLVVDVDDRLNIGGDTIILLNSSGIIVDQVTYGSGVEMAPEPGEGNSTGRYPNGVDTDNDAADFREFGTPTPGASNEEDTTPPTITEVSPTDGATNVPVTTAISATFSEAMNETSAEAAFSVDGVTGTFGWDGNKMTFTPSSELAYNTEYTVTISTVAEDLAGNNLASDYTWSFTTERFELPFSVIPPGTTYIMNITVDTVIPTNVGENATIVFFDETAVIDTETYNVTTMTKPVGGGKLYLGVDYTTENYTMKRTVEKNVPGLEAANLTFDPAYVMLDYPLWVEKTWTTTTNVTGMLLNETGAEIPINTIAVVSGEVTDEVDLTVPYGTIHCLVVEVNVSLQYPPISFLTRYWMSDHGMALMPKYQSHVSGSLVEELELISVTIPDTTPPEIFNPQPADGSFINDTTPTISANYSDLGTGINESSVEIVVDGTDVTLDTNTTVTATGVSYIADLSEGLHTVTVNVSDNATTPNTNSTSWAFTVDITKPTIEFIAPTPGNNTEVTDNYVEVVVNVTDNFDLTHAVGILWWNETEEPMTKTLYAADKGKFNYTMTDLANGNYTYKVYANDTAGNMNVSETRFVTVDVTGLPKTGDINNDGEVKLSDAIYLAKHVVGLSGYETIYADGDINSDGEVKLSDAIYLAKHVVGLSGYETIYP